MMPVQRAGVTEAQLTWLGREGRPLPNLHLHKLLACDAAEPLAGAWSKSLGLTSIFFSARRPGREAGTGRLCILREVIHGPAEKARK